MYFGTLFALRCQTHLIMKTTALFLLSLFFSIHQAFANVPAKLTAAKIYLQGAELRHQANISYQKGSQEIILSGIAAQLDLQSMQIAATASDLKLLGYEVRKNYLRQNDELPEIKVLVDSLAILQEQLNLEKSMSQVLQQEREIILANKLVGGQNTGMQVAELQKLADFYRSRLTALNLESQASNRKYAAIHTAWKRINQTLQSRRAQLPEFVHELVLSIAAPAAGKSVLQISYFCPAVSWAPYYEIHAGALDQPLELIAKAQIYQNSMLDWENIEVVVSSAQPSTRVEKPQLNPWFLNFGSDTYQIDGIAVRGSRAKQLAVQMDEEMPAFSNVRGLDPAKQINYLNYEYQPKERLSLRNNASQFVELEVKTLESSYGHLVAPRMRKEVQLVAYVTNWQALNLLSGEGRIFMQNALVAETFLNFKASSDTLELALGVDPRVQIKYEQNKSFTSDRRLGNTRKQDFGYTIQVKNLHQTPVQLQVLEVLPISKNSEIEVIDVKIEGAERLDEQGRIRWNVPLAANGEWQVAYSFSVKYPKGKTIGNL